jgi:hypothetical protein
MSACEHSLLETVSMGSAQKSLSPQVEPICATKVKLNFTLNSGNAIGPARSFNLRLKTMFERET